MKNTTASKTIGGLTMTRVHAWHVANGKTWLTETTTINATGALASVWICEVGTVCGYDYIGAGKHLVDNYNDVGGIEVR